VDRQRQQHAHHQQHQASHQEQQHRDELAEQEQVLMQMFPATASAAAELQRVTKEAPELQYAQAQQGGGDGSGVNGQHAPV
jgi:hypothetical protein